MLVTGKASLMPLGIILFCLSWGANVHSLTADIGNKRYYIPGQKGSWHQANLACSAVGMSMATLESAAEYTSLRSYLINEGNWADGFWLGGSNLANPNPNTDYVWFSSGNKVNYSQWASQQPKNTVAYCIYTDNKFQWSTDDCDAATNYYFLCSRPLLPNCGITGRCKRNRSFF